MIGKGPPIHPGHCLSFSIVPVRQSTPLIMLGWISGMTKPNDRRQCAKAS